MDQSQYLAQALRAMQESQGQPQQSPNAMGLSRMQPGMGQTQGQPMDPNARPTIGDNLQQAWSNAQGAPARMMQSFDQAGQNLMGAPQRFQDSVMGLGKLFK